MKVDPLKFYKISAFLHEKSFKRAAFFIRNLNFFLFKAYLPPSCKIGAGTVLGYKGMGVVVHSSSVVGEKCVIAHGVTLGTAVPYTTNLKLEGPRIGNNTFVGAGAKILGNITVGSNCTIAAGAVVLRNIPDNSIAVGIPARIIGMNRQDYKAIVMGNEDRQTKF